MHRLVDDAIATLPPEQRAAVQLHYVEGLKLWEIASLLGSPLGTIKARLHRARAQLREALLETMVVTAGRPAIAMEAMMVEVTVEDVVVRAPKHEETRWLAAKGSIASFNRVLLLRERAGDRVLPIWVGPIEGDLIVMRLVDLATVRPMPTDLLARILDVGTMRLEKVVVNSLRDKTYFASLWIRTGTATREIDSRPSDAIALALEVGAPIFVATQVFEDSEANVLRLGEALPGLEAIQQRWLSEEKTTPEAEEREWRSLRSLPQLFENRHIRPRAR
jgi:bifunctional DNase/RNase